MQKRHTCIICKKKKVESKMILLLLELNNWFCSDCKNNSDINILIKIHHLKNTLKNKNLRKLI
jgi:hypothetical protein